MAVSTTLQQLITGALVKINAYAIGQNIPAPVLQQCVTWAQQMIDAWGLDPNTIPSEVREVFALVSGKGGTGTSTPTSGPYTIGPSADFDTIRPEWVTGAGLLQLATTPHVEIPRALLTNDAYQSIAMKDLQSEYFTSVYYNATYPLGTIQLYPVPNTTTNSLVLYSNQPIPAFTSLTASYTFPPGYAKVIEDNLAVEFSDPMGRVLPAGLANRASVGLMKLKRANMPDVDLGLDPALTQTSRRPWNVLSDS